MGRKPEGLPRNSGFSKFGGPLRFLWRDGLSFDKQPFEQRPSNWNDGDTA